MVARGLYLFLEARLDANVIENVADGRPADF